MIQNYILTVLCALLVAAPLGAFVGWLFVKGCDK